MKDLGSRISTYAQRFWVRSQDVNVTAQGFEFKVGAEDRGFGFRADGLRLRVEGLEFGLSKLCFGPQFSGCDGRFVMALILSHFLLRSLCFGKGNLLNL